MTGNPEISTTTGPMITITTKNNGKNDRMTEGKEEKDKNNGKIDRMTEGKEGEEGKGLHKDELVAENRQSSHRWTSQHFEWFVSIATHVLAILVYYIPLRQDHPHYETTLDEMHILSDEQRDVVGTSSLSDVFLNDYWGRPMSKMDSHKSWRPFGILSFRYLKQNLGFDIKDMSLVPRTVALFGNIIPIQNDIFIARMVTVVIHAALAEMISQVACSIFYPQKSNNSNTNATGKIVLRATSKLLFALHPTHVEAVANGANRPHVLAVLCSILATDLQSATFLSMAIFAVGLMCSETAIFQLPAVLCTLTLVHWKRSNQQNYESLKHAIWSLLPKYMGLITVAMIYLFGRIYFKTTDIPEGLIRPAENPFYDFRGLKRAVNYSFILLVHVGKSWFIDPIGFSHEYGYNCVREIGEGYISGPFGDIRFHGVLWTAIAFMFLFTKIMTCRDHLNLKIHFVTACSWMATLFPICGILKVGTFIADRLVVASTVAISIWGGFFISNIITRLVATSSKRSTLKSIKLVIMLGAVICGLSRRIYRRSRHWMSSHELLKSSLVTCPNSAKSNLEISKCYSGLFEDMLDYDKAESYLQRASEIDPNYCDIHWQYAQLYYKTSQYDKFEKHLVKAVLCPFTMGGALPLYQQYWKIVTDTSSLGSTSTANTNKVLAAIKRKQIYDKQIQEAIDVERQKEQEAEKKKQKLRENAEL